VRADPPRQVLCAYEPTVLYFRFDGKTTRTFPSLTEHIQWSRRQEYGLPDEFLSDEGEAAENVDEYRGNGILVNGELSFSMGVGMMRCKVGRSLGISDPDKTPVQDARTYTLGIVFCDALNPCTSLHVLAKRLDVRSRSLIPSTSSTTSKSCPSSSQLSVLRRLGSHQEARACCARRRAPATRHLPGAGRRRRQAKHEVLFLQIRPRALSPAAGSWLLACALRGLGKYRASTLRAVKSGQASCRYCPGNQAAQDRPLADADLDHKLAQLDIAARACLLQPLYKTEVDCLRPGHNRRNWFRESFARYEADIASWRRRIADGDVVDIEDASALIACWPEEIVRTHAEIFAL
jgi:hypothetical protein